MPAYTTYRRVEIEDKSVGRVYYGFFGATLLLIAYYAVFQKLHLFLDENPGGSVFMRLSHPPRPRSTLGDTKMHKTPCEGYQHPDTHCEQRDWLDAVEFTQDSLFIETFIQEKLQKRNFSSYVVPGDGKYLWEDVDSANIYVDNPEDFLLLIEHRLHKTLYRSGSNSYDIEGVDLKAVEYSPLSSRGAIQRSKNALPTTKSFPPKARDNFTLDLIFDLHSISLEDSFCDGCKVKGYQDYEMLYRSRGISFDLLIVYSNLWWSWSQPLSWLLPGEMKYEYQVDHIPNLQGVRRFDTVPTSRFLKVSQDHPDIGYRIRRRVFGIEIKVHQLGLIGSLSATSILMFVIGASTTVSLAYTACELYLTVLSVIHTRHLSWHNKLFYENKKKKRKSP